MPITRHRMKLRIGSASESTEDSTSSDSSNSDTHTNSTATTTKTKSSTHSTPVSGQRTNNGRDRGTAIKVKKDAHLLQLGSSCTRDQQNHKNDQTRRAPEKSTHSDDHSDIPVVKTENDTAIETRFTPAMSFDMSLTETVRLVTTSVLSNMDHSRGAQVIVPNFSHGTPQEVMAYVRKLDKAYQPFVTSDSGFLRQVALKLSGDADNWYCTSGCRCKTYSQFRENFVTSMLPVNYEEILILELLRQTQGNDEAFGPFCRKIWRQFLDIDPDIDERYIVKVLLQNAKPSILALMGRDKDFNSVSQLITIGQHVEAVLRGLGDVADA